MLFIKALEFYTKNIEKAKNDIKELDKKISLIGWVRLLIVIGMLYFGYKFFKSNNVTLLVISEVIIIGILALVVLYHTKLMNKKRKHNIFIDINKRGIDRVNGEFKNVVDNGSDYIDDTHAFSSDLDIFGKNSLFALINDTTTKGGRDRLSKELTLENFKEIEGLKEKSKGIKELSEKATWRQNLRVNGIYNFKNTKKEINEIEALKDFSKSEVKRNKLSKLIAYFMIAFNALSIIASITSIIPLTYLILVLIIDYGVVTALTKKKKEELVVFKDLKNTIKIYADAVSLIEEEDFESSYIRNIKDKLKTNSNISARYEMKSLASLSEWVGDSTSNAFYLVLNILFFLDVFIIENLEAWKYKNGKHLEEWLSVVSEIDALSSISNLHFDNETWVFPDIVKEKVVVAKEVGHPLIGNRAVRNDYSLENGKMVTLITGSNMSGKSTFLRTIGLNLVLSYIGAPVFAKEFKCGRFNVSTCMRTKDNLEESISSFYAEILRIKLLIEKTEKGEDVFFLLDEIFKGTNSEDRHTGAKELIAQLMKGDARGIVSTHDFELCDLEKEDKRIENYNFREYYEDNKIKFDYKLRKGRSTTQNAIHLMKLAGIKF